MSPRFFGNSSRPLFGIYHPARAGRGGSKQVLLCPPIGHEYMRTHWALRSLASKLTRQGCSVFRFDYRGVGDSSADVSEVEQLSAWVEDTVEAALELREASANPAPLTLVGLRFGAILAQQAAEMLTRKHGIAGDVLLWEPPLNGRSYLAETRALHFQMVDLWINRIVTDQSDSYEEILGSRFSKRLLQDIEQQCWPTGCDDLGESGSVATVIGSGTTINAWKQSQQGGFVSDCVATNDDGDWYDLRFIEEAWIPSASPDAIVTCLNEGEDKHWPGKPVASRNQRTLSEAT